MKTLELHNISKKYRNNIILSKVNIDFIMGKCYMIIGSNGSGKSTLLKIINELIYPNEGYIKKNGLVFGYVPEKIFLPQYLTVMKFLMLLMKIRTGEESESKIENLLEYWEITSAKDKRIKELSKGMLQKVLLIQSMLHDPDVYIFDEVLNGLDIDMQKKLLHVLINLKKRNKMIIITSHHIDLYQDIIDVKIIIKNSTVSVIA